MKMALLVCNTYFEDRVMETLQKCGIDYYTSWDGAKGKGHGTEPHLGKGAYGSTNSVIMIGFEDEQPLEKLIEALKGVNADIRRAADRVRLFQLPLDRIV